ncbi:MAG TPA: alpha-1,2-fucosyltransferase [Chitinophagales bacterium]|nr:alpha-1,2-fucosyltransferase [Chitinophagales bacterium]
MIIVKIFQGLGNQLFQYAYSRALALNRGCMVKLDNTYYNQYSEIILHGYKVKRQYGLDRFNIKMELATQAEIDHVKNYTGNNRISRYINRKLNEQAPYYKKREVKELDTVFDKNLLQVSNNSYVQGYFASEMYFKNHRETLLNELTLRSPLSEQNAATIQRMRDTDSVCVSIRRADFLVHPLHNVCTDQYYQDGLNAMGELVKNMRVFIFSDDNEYVSKNFHIPFSHEFVTHNHPDFYEDLRLMTNCKHHVIPNSTFSWWGAWLSQYPGKKVIAPRIWLNSNTIDYSTVLPQEWIKIENKF